MSKLLYTDEHLSCYNYEKGDKLAIEGLKFEAANSWENIVDDSKIIFVVEGSLRISYGDIIDKEVHQGQMFILRQGYHYKAYAEKDIFIMIFRMNAQINLCDRFSLQQLYAEGINTQDDFNALTINEQLGNFLKWTFINISNGLKCTHFLDIKRQELFFLLRAYYSKEDLALFFRPLLNNDQIFSNFIYENHYKVKNIQQLVSLSNYSVSAFNKRFKKSFGISPYRWMKEERAKRIFHEINNYSKNFKVISEEYGFSSLSQFNDFCKVHFGLTPGEIRKKD